MVQVEVIRTERFTLEDVSILSEKYLDRILINSRSLSKQQIIGYIQELRDELDRYT